MRLLRVSTSLAAGAATGVVGYALLAEAWCPAVVRLAVAVALMGVVPSGRTLARRVAVNGVVVLGSVPLLWIPSGFRALNHGVLVLALVLGALTTHLLVRRPRRDAACRLLPEVGPADVLLLVAGAASVAWAWRLLTVRTPARALEVLLPGYDHTAHFDIFQMMWTHGVLIDALPSSPDGSAWTYANYPAGYHAVSVSMAQLLTTLRPRSDAVAVVTFAHVDAGVVVLGTLTVVACLISSFQRPRLLALIAPTTLLLSALLWMPGGQMLWYAFENFWLAGVLAACSLMLAGRALVLGEASWSGLVAVLAGVVGTSMNWLPLLVLSWIAPVAVFVLWWPAQRGRRWSRVLGVALCGVGLVLVGRTALVLHQTVPLSTLASATGGIQAAPPGAVTLAILLFVLLSTLVARRPRRSSQTSLRRLLWTGAGIVTGAATAAVLALLQRSGGSSAHYYVIKLTLGVVLVTGCWLAFLAAQLAHRWLKGPAPGPGTAAVRVLSVILAAIVATQVLGHMSLAEGSQEARRTVDRDLAGRELDYPAMARGILAASRTATPGRSVDTAYVALGPAHCYTAALPDTWLHGLRGSLSVDALATSQLLSTQLTSPTDAVTPIRAAVDADPRLTVLVDAAYLGEVQRLVGSPYAAHVHALAAETHRG